MSVSLLPRLFFLCHVLPPWIILLKPWYYNLLSKGKHYIKLRIFTTLDFLLYVTDTATGSQGKNCCQNFLFSKPLVIKKKNYNMKGIRML